VTSVDPVTLNEAVEAGFRAALRAGLGELDARDLAQEAVIRALTSTRPPPDVPLAAWTYGVARNLGRDHHKSAQRRELLVDAPETEDTPDLATVLSVRRAVEALPEPLRAIVTLHELEQRSLRETADVLQIPFDTAKDRLRRAREQLRTSLADADSACATERAVTQRRATAQRAAIVAAITAVLAERNVATAATAATAIVAGTRLARGWYAAAGAALLAGGFAIGRTTAPRPPEPAPVVAVTTPSELPPAVALAPEPAIAPVGSARSTPPKLAAREARAPSRDAERLLLDRARTAIGRGTYDEALVELMEHARRFPDGAFQEERDVLIIDAYARAGRDDLARQGIERYRAAYPAGVLSARVAAIAATIAK